MTTYYVLVILVVLPGYSWAITFYSPFCSSPCQVTKGPGSYGKSSSDIRYRDGWRWNCVSSQQMASQSLPKQSQRKRSKG